MNEATAVARLFAVSCALSIGCSEYRPLTPRPAAEYIVNAFDRYPLIALSEIHGNDESRDLLARLIRYPGFAGKVNDIVVEFGNARYQGAVDRYIAGESVARDDLRGAWEDTTQISDIWSLPMYETMLADIRAVNLTLPASRRFRVLLGDPPIDWAHVTSPADEDMNDWRDAHYAWVVEKAVRAAGRRALLFVGGAHISRTVVFPNSLIHLLDARLPGQTHVVSVVDVGAADPRIATTLRTWPAGSAASVRGTRLGRERVETLGWRFSRGLVEQDVDAIVYLSPSPLQFQLAPALSDSSPRAAEMKRRRTLAAASVPFRGARIRFEPAVAILSPTSVEALDAVLAELRADRALELVVKAFADPAEPSPLALTVARAQSVIDWLASRGVARTRLLPLGCGRSRPLWNDNLDEHRAANRRAELVRNTPTAGCEPPSSVATSAPPR